MWRGIPKPQFETTTYRSQVYFKRKQLDGKNEQNI